MTDTNNTSDSSESIHKNNNKTLLATIASLLVGLTGGYYINENNMLAKPNGSSTDTKVEAVVKRVIADNPQLLMDSLQSLQRKNYEKQMEQAKDGLSKYQKELKEDELSPFVGDKNAKVTVIEFYDYHCGYCKKVAPTFKKLVESYPDIKVIFKEFPILSPDSHSAARAALAVSKLNPSKYFTFHQMLMETQGAYSDDVLKKLAGKVDVNGEKLLAEMQKDWVTKQLQDVATLAGNLGIQGTPAIIVGNELIPGAIEYDALEAKVKALK